MLTKLNQTGQAGFIHKLSYHSGIVERRSGSCSFGSVVLFERLPLKVKLINKAKIAVYASF